MRNCLIGFSCALLFVTPSYTARGDLVRTAHAAEPAGDRWMYLWNPTPGLRASASTYSALPDLAGVDDEDRMAQFIIRFDTVAAGIPAGLGAQNYHPQRVILTAVLENAGVLYDSTEDARETYGPGATADSDPGRPLELHGTGFRGSFTEATFLETSAYGSATRGGRNAYALGYASDATARDVSNNVSSGFNSVPWAIGKLLTRDSELEDWRDLEPGSAVRVHDLAVFELNLSLPGVADYVKQGFHNGYLWLTLSSLHSTVQQAASGFPSYFTRDHAEQEFYHDVAPTLDVDYTLPLKIAAFHRDGTAGISHLEWNASPGFEYTVETSTDLAADSWLKVTTTTLTTASPAQMTFNAPASATRAFYRIVRTKP